MDSFLVEQFTTSAFGAVMDPVLLGGAAAVGWFVRERENRVFLTVVLAAAFALGMLWLGRRAGVLWILPSDETGYVVAGTAGRWIVAWPFAELLAHITRRRDISDFPKEPLD
jgi:hypothetical protein